MLVPKSNKVLDQENSTGFFNLEIQTKKWKIALNPFVIFLNHKSSLLDYLVWQGYIQIWPWTLFTAIRIYIVKF